MKKALIAKFEQHRDLYSKLLSSSPAKLVEDSPTDSFWGGSLPYSRNMLGELLMEIRDKKLIK